MSGTLPQKRRGPHSFPGRGSLFRPRPARRALPSSMAHNSSSWLPDRHLRIGRHGRPRMNALAGTPIMPVPAHQEANGVIARSHNTRANQPA